MQMTSKFLSYSKFFKINSYLLIGKSIIMNKEKIKNKIIQSATKKSGWLKDAKWRQKNRDWLNMSGRIALKVLLHLDEEKITQKALAKQLGWSPQYLNKVLKGSENLTLETICKLQRATGLVLIEVPKFEYEKEKELVV